MRKFGIWAVVLIGISILWAALEMAQDEKQKPLPGQVPKHVPLPQVEDPKKPRGIKPPLPPADGFPEEKAQERPSSTPLKKVNENAARLGVDCSSEAQAKRLKLIQSWIGDGIFTKVEWFGSAPKVWATEKFKRELVDGKKLGLGIVFSYYVAETEFFGKQLDFVGVNDAYTDKRLGTFFSSGVLNWE